MLGWICNIHLCTENEVNAGEYKNGSEGIKCVKKHFKGFKYKIKPYKQIITNK